MGKSKNRFFVCFFLRVSKFVLDFVGFSKFSFGFCLVFDFCLLFCLFFFNMHVQNVLSFFCGFCRLGFIFFKSGV